MPRHRIACAIRRHGLCCRAAILLLSGLLVMAPAFVTFAQDTTVARTASKQRFAAHIAEASLRFRIPEHWIRAVLGAESAYDIRAVSSAGAMGLMQIMPDTWAELRAHHRLGDDPFEPRDNILAGTAYLREMLDRYGHVGGMLAAYNAGPARYDEYLATGRPLPAETRDYVAKLARVLSGKPLPDSAPKPSRRTDWRDAPLFVVPAGGASFGGSQQPGAQSDATSGEESANRDSATPAQTGHIFVATSGEVTFP
jgi:Transglycosylase SLT domain